MFQIKSVALSSLNQGKFGTFHNVVNQLIEKAGYKTTIEALSVRYAADATTYADLVKYGAGSAFSTAMQLKDLQRDALYSFIRSGLALLAKSDDADVVAFYNEKVAKLLQTYKGEIAAEAYAEETLHLRSFISDCRELDAEMLAKGYVTAQMLTDLANLNDSFETAYVARTEERLEYIPEKIKTQRLVLSNDYALICATATVDANTAVTDANAAMVAAARKFIDLLNEHIDYQYKYYIAGTSTEPNAGNGENSEGSATEGGNTEGGNSTGSGSGNGSGSDNGSGSSTGSGSGSGSGSSSDNGGNNDGGGSNSEAII